MCRRCWCGARGGGTTYRVALIEVSHESNTFSMRPTTLQDFATSRHFVGAEMIARMRGTGSEIGGALTAAEALGWQVVPILAAQAQPAGPVTEAARQAITGAVVGGLREAGPLDGIFLALHGAMVTETDPDGESQLLRAIRAVVGPDLPIAVTLDLHANIFDEMAGLVQIVVSYRTYPHVDMAECGSEACTLLHRAMTGEIRPRVAIARPPMLLGCGDGRTTGTGPMPGILDLAAAEARAQGILNVAVNAGFTDADVAVAGPSVLVTHDASVCPAERALAAAQRVCAEIWRHRDDWDMPMDLDSCIAELRGRPAGQGPVVVADFSDNPGSGGYGDCTALLAALLRAGIGDAAFGALYDPVAARALARAGVGARRRLAIGGRTDPSVGGGPLTVEGTVRAVSAGTFRFEGPLWSGLPGSTGLSVCFRTGGIDVMIVSENLQMLDLNIFRAVGIDPARKSVVAVKSMQHFRGAFEPIAARVLVVDAGGLCTPNVARRTYRRLRRPVFPLDAIDA